MSHLKHVHRWTPGALMLLLSLLPAVVRADLAPPISIRLASELVPARAGELYRGTLELRTHASVRLLGLRFAPTPGWTQIRIDLPLARDLGRGTVRSVDFEAFVTDPEEPLNIVVDLDVGRFEQTLDLSPAAILRATRPGSTVVVADAPPIGTSTPTDGGLDLPAPERWPLTKPDDSVPSDADAGPSGLARASRSIRVRGRFGYVRSYEYNDGPYGDGLYAGAHRVGVWVLDDDGTSTDDLLAFGYTDAQGRFDLTFTWDSAVQGEAEPDLYVIYQLSNEKVDVVEPTADLPYWYATGTEWNYTGADISFGTREPSVQADRGRVSLFTAEYRAYLFGFNYGGGDAPALVVRTPNGGPNGGWGINNFPDDWSVWHEQVPFHEWGHHYVASMGTPSHGHYCNEWDYCDDDPGAGNCNHCAWCNEDGQTAHNEGFPYWIAASGLPSILADYGIAPLGDAKYETLPAICRGLIGGVVAPCDCDPELTEGMFTAVLYDMEDSASDNDPKFTTSFADVMDVSPATIFTVMRFDLGPDPTPIDYLRAYRARYPNVAANLWETAKNNGYDLDEVAPGAPSGLTSSSHATGSTTTDNTVDISWSKPTDDWSGVGGYSILIRTGSAGLPDMTAEIIDGNVTAYTSPPLAAGTNYYVSVRAVDRAGRWSGSMATYGPFNIVPPTPTDLEFVVPAGWAYAVVPRPTNDGTTNSVPAPSTLTGDATSTWGNMRGINLGDYATEGFRISFLVDGVARVHGSVPTLGPNQQYQALNFGPMNVIGGRHTFEGRLDVLDDVVESDELDNAWAMQWVWSPSALTLNVDNQFPTPPSRDGGWSAVSGGKWYNTRGVRFTSAGWWNAVVIHSEDGTADNDARLHAASTGPLDGFTTNQGWSARAIGCTDAVLVNRNVTGTVAPWDVGVINMNSHASAVHVRQIQSAAIANPGTQTISLASQEMMVLREIAVLSDDLGWFNVHVEVDPADGPLHVNLMAPDFATGDLGDRLVTATTDAATGLLSLDVDLSTTGYYGLAVYRDPKDGTGAMDFVLKIGPSTPDLRPGYDANWAAPIVPRPQLDQTWPWSTVPAPTVLVGNTQATYFYTKAFNAGPVGAGPLRTIVECDGGVIRQIYDRSSGIAAGAYDQFSTGGGMTVPGGRHTIALRVDGIDEIVEVLEGNNVYAEQWVWSPLPLELDVPLARNAPPPRTAGWSDIEPGSPLWYNADGLRTPVFAPNEEQGWVTCVAIVPRAGADHDLRIHTVRDDVKTAFAANVVSSAWGTGFSDFVLFDLRRTEIRQWDVGVISWAGTDGYDLEVSSSAYVGSEPVGAHGPYTLGGGRIVDLYEMTLTAGDHAVALENAGGSVDWGLSVYGPSQAVHRAKSAVMEGSAASWIDGPGVGEAIDFTVAIPGRYVVAVWKVGASDVGLTGDYRLVFENAATGVDQEPIAPRTAITLVQPNPFNPRTTIHFEIERSGPVELEVFNSRGLLVRRLVHASMPAGRHEVTWSGTDDRGAPAASGIYFVRLEFEGTVRQEKVTLLK